MSIENIFIVGAGFSANAGLPLTSGFTERLLDVSKFADDAPSALLAQLLQKFVSDTFSTRAMKSAKDWPELEDIFTCVDLSANTGHHLGRTYSPSQLRTIRRALIVRTIRMLRQNYTAKQRHPDARSRNLKRFFAEIDVSQAAFLSMNWDTVIEDGLKSEKGISEFDYNCDAVPARFKSSMVSIRKGSLKTATILKPHGSANWLYCDSCRQLFAFAADQTLRIASQLFKERDWNVVNSLIGAKRNQKIQPRPCPLCGADSLGTRFATFSYRKALDFPMYTKTWSAAERLLRDAKNWIFVGYSLPAADYEFKLLLKRIQLSRPQPPTLHLITGGSSAAAAQTLKNYRKFFGSSFMKGTTYFANGFSPSAFIRLAGIGALKASAN